MKSLKILILAATVAAISGCGSAKKFDKTKIQSIKKVAVVMYTVPETISYREDPRESGGKGLIAAVVDAANRKNGTKAATIAHKNFVNNLQNMKGLPFEVMPYDEMMANKEFTALYVAPKAEEKKENLAGKALSFLNKLGGQKKNVGAAPEKMNQFGLAEWNKGSALTGAKNEKEYIKSAIDALRVDGVLVINDSGFSFVCEACVGSSGAASTGSAFTATVLTRDQQVAMDIQEYFLTTDAQAAMVTGTVNPLQHKSLFEEHGKKMAVVFSDFVSGKLKE